MSIYVDVKRGNKIKKFIKNVFVEITIKVVKIVALPIIFLVGGDF